MIEDTEQLNVEMSLDAVAEPVTPNGSGYQRSNFYVPTIDPDEHRIAVEGQVNAPSTLGVADLAAMRQRTVTVTTECAGNDRRSMRPLPPGEQWGSLAVSTVRWSGVSLGDVLCRAGVAKGGTHVVVEGEDTGPRDDARGIVRFARGLPLAVALAPDVILATHMNGERLLPQHGAPVRLVVPGWYGMANVKWVRRIEVTTSEFAGYFQRQRYVYDEDGVVRPVSRMRVKSLIVSPGQDAEVRSGALRVWGWAWSGEGAIARVEVSGGGAWHTASLSPGEEPHAWTRWECVMQLPARGRVVLRSRATDAAGNVQPDEIRWNRLGYGNNAIQCRLITVA